MSIFAPQKKAGCLHLARQTQYQLKVPEFAVDIMVKDSQVDMVTHRIHGAAIYGNMDPINIPPLC